MNLLLFCTLFIAQFVGHNAGDYLIQGEQDALKKSTSIKHRFRHCLMYTASVVLPIAIALWSTLSVGIIAAIAAVTFIEHMIVDSRRPVTGWKTFFEHRIMRNKAFDVANLPFFVLIEIDQTFHLVRMFLIAVAVGYWAA